MRIVGGKHAGRDLTSPNDFRVRPTAEHVRAALLDLGLEALSRGARRCDFVETRPASLHALKANVVALRMKERSRIFKKDALPFAAALREGSYDLAFADPPYGSRMLDRVIASWKEHRFARVLAVEHETSHEIPKGNLRRVFDETAFTIYRLNGGQTP
jgi:16S rRNA (guanine966-N2)-methyltransferase